MHSAEGALVQTDKRKPKGRGDNTDALVVRLGPLPSESRKVPFSSYVTPTAARGLEDLAAETGMSRVELLQKAFTLLFKAHSRRPLVHRHAPLPSEPRKVPFSSYVTLAAAHGLEDLAMQTGITRVELLHKALNFLFKSHGRRPAA